MSDLPSRGHRGAHTGREYAPTARGQNIHAPLERRRVDDISQSTNGIRFRLPDAQSSGPGGAGFGFHFARNETERILFTTTHSPVYNAKSQAEIFILVVEKMKKCNAGWQS
jgi:hypothetical protein